MTRREEGTKKGEGEPGERRGEATRGEEERTRRGEHGESRGRVTRGREGKGGQKRPRGLRERLPAGAEL